MCLSQFSVDADQRYEEVQPGDHGCQGEGGQDQQVSQAQLSLQLVLGGNPGGKTSGYQDIKTEEIGQQP